MSFFSRKAKTQVPPVQDDPPAPQPARDPYGYGSNDRYGAAPDRYGAAPDRYAAGSDRYGAAPDRYGSAPAPDRYGSSPAPDRYGSAQPDRYGATQEPAPRATNKLQRPPPSAPVADRYNEPDRYDAPPRARAAAGDPYARGGDPDADRSALFSGYNPDAPRRFTEDRQGGGPPGGMLSEEELDRRRADGGDEEEDIEAIRGAIKGTKQESLASTRNALRIAREAEETARNTLNKLGDQSEQLADAEQHIDRAKWNSVRAADRTDELKQLNRSIFRPVITFNKDKKRAAQEAKMLARHEEERDERQRLQSEVRDTHARVGGPMSSGGGSENDPDGGPARGGRYQTQAELDTRKKARQRYQFEATASDDELEDELDDNLDEVGDAVTRMKGLALAMGKEVDQQNVRLQRFEQKTDEVDNKVISNTNRLKKIK